MAAVPDIVGDGEEVLVTWLMGIGARKEDGQVM